MPNCSPTRALTESLTVSYFLSLLIFYLLILNLLIFYLLIFYLLIFYQSLYEQAINNQDHEESDSSSGEVEMSAEYCQQVNLVKTVTSVTEQPSLVSLTSVPRHPSPDNRHMTTVTSVTWQPLLVSLDNRHKCHLTIVT